MSADLPPPLRHAANDQRGMLSLAQVLESGASRGILISRLKQGRWQRVYRGVYATFSGKLSREAELWAAVLYAGPGAVLSYRTAAELGGLAEPSSPIHVTVPASRRVRPQPGLVVHLSKRAGESAHPTRQPPQTRLEETVLDLWETARDFDAAVGWVTRAIGRGLTTQDRLREALAKRRQIRWRPLLAQLLSLDLAGVHSVLEYRYVRDVERPHGFPAATRQAYTRRDGRSQYRDTLYEEYSTVVELDGQSAHPGDTRWDDIRRDNAAAATGLRTLRYGWRDVAGSPCAVAAEVAPVLADQGYTGTRPCSPTCPVGRQPRPPASGGSIRNAPSPSRPADAVTRPPRAPRPSGNSRRRTGARPSPSGRSTPNAPPAAPPSAPTR